MHFAKIDLTEHCQVFALLESDVEHLVANENEALREIVVLAFILDVASKNFFLVDLLPLFGLSVLPQLLLRRRLLTCLFLDLP